MRPGLRFNITTVVGIACFSLCAFQTFALSNDESGDHESATTTEAASHEKSHGKEPSEAHGSEASHGGEEAHGAEHGHDDEHGEKPNPIEVSADLSLWTLITFLIMLVILRLTAWKPLMSALEARETGIMNNVQGANKARIEAEQAFADYQSKMQKAEDEVRQLLADARKAAENARAEMLAATQKEVSTLKDRALEEIDQVRVQALEELFSHMAATVTKATEQVIRRSLTPADQERLVSEAVEQFVKR